MALNRPAVSLDQLTIDRLSRRNFMRFSGGCAALSSTSILSQILNLQLTGAAVAQEGTPSGDYKALVCVFLNGGIDSHNVLAPYTDAEYAHYQSIRTDLAIAKDDPDPNLNLLPVDGNHGVNQGRQFGIHPTMTGVHELYQAGNLAFVANVGSVVVPTTKATLNSVKLPLGLYSHADLIQHWQSSIPQSRSQISGWGGRMADLMASTHNANEFVSMNIALGSLNIFQTGNQVIPYVINNSTGATLLNGYTSTGVVDTIHRNFIDQVYPQNVDTAPAATYSDLLRKTLYRTKRGSIQAAIEFNEATSIGDDAALFAPFDGLTSGFANNLRMVARSIKARARLGQTRQIFFVSAGGWDHHADLLQNQTNMLPVISQALKAFYDTTVNLGVASEVTTFTASDFARTLSTNGSGSDHGWGGNHIVMGGAVQGNKVFGDYPDNLKTNNLDTGRGRLIPTLSVDEYNAEMAMWFGVSNSQMLVDILPNIRNFYSSGATAKPIGFLA